MMKNFRFLLAAAAMTPVLALSGTTTVDLIAGGGGIVTPDKVIGNVIASDDGTNLNVKYEIANPYLPGGTPASNDGTWRIIKTHTHAGDSLASFPLTNKGAPKIGGFSDNPDEHEGVASVERPLAIPTPNDGTLTIGAHAEVEQMTAVPDYLALAEENSNIKLPQEVNLTVAAGTVTYLRALIESNDDLNGFYEHSWCIDPEHPISGGVKYSTVWAVSSYDGNFTEYMSGGPFDGYIGEHIENPLNLDVVNYIINEFDDNKYLDENEDPVHMCNIQQALWMVTNNKYGTCNDWDEDITEEIVSDALVNGQDYKPGCDDEMVIVLIGDPAEGSSTHDIQTVIVHIPVPCKETWGEETAWGGEYDKEGTLKTINRFIDKKKGGNWFMWFEHELGLEL